MTSAVTVTDHLRVQVSPLCGPERHFWIHPDLAVAMLAWSMDPLVCHPQGAFELAPAYGNENSQLGRNKACRQFLDGDMDYLLMVDNDTIPRHPITGEYLNLMAMAYWGVDIVAALVPTTTKAPEGGALIWGYNAYKRHDDGYRMMSQEELEAIDPTDLRDDPGQPDARIPLKLVDVVGFGAVMLSRRVVEAVSNHITTYPNGPDTSGEARILRHGESHIVPVLRERGADGATRFGEDFLFCHRAKHLGYLSYTAPSLYCDHAHTLDMGKLPTMRAVRSPLAKEKPKQADTLVPQDPNRIPLAAHITGYGPHFGPVAIQWMPEHYNLHHRHPPDYPPLPPITNYSIEPDLAHYLRGQIEHNPKITHILELGSGISTVVMAEALVSTGRKGCWLLSVDHDGEYQYQISESLTEAELGVMAFANIPLDTCGFYEGRHDTQTYDLLLIDGPPGQYNGRRHAHRLFNQVKQGGLVILDDADRPDEAKAIRHWCRESWLTPVERVGRAQVMMRTDEKVEL